MSPEEKARLLDRLEQSVTSLVENSRKVAEDRKAKGYTFENFAKAIDQAHDRIDVLDATRQKAAAYGGSSPIEGKGPLLTLEQKAAPHFTPEEGRIEDDFDAKNVRLGAVVVGALHYDKVKSQLSPDERKALGILTDPSGGMLLPTAIGHLFIDAIRPRVQLLQAGALTYAMEALNVTLPGWDTPPKAGWRGPSGTFGDAGGSFRNVQLNAKDCGCFLDIPNTLFEDASVNLDGVSQLVEAQLAKAVAQAIDLAGLLSQDALSSSGTATPQGLASLDSQSQLTANYGINVASSSGTNGGTPNWDWFIDAVAAVATANFSATGHLSAPRAFASLAKTKDSQQRYLGRPEYLSDVGDYETSQVPVTLKKGTSTDCTASFVGDFSQMVVGLRGEIAMLRDPYTQGLSRTTRLIIWQKADIGVLNKGAFQIVDGVRP